MDTKVEFIQMLESTGSAPRTVAAYRLLLGKLEHRTGKDATGVGGLGLCKTILEFLSDLPQTKHGYVQVTRLSRYLRFLEDKGHIFLSPLRGRPNRRYPRTTHPVLDTSEFEGMLENIRTDTPLCLKGRAIMELAYSSALRPREIYDLKIEDIDFADGLLFIRQSKGRKDRIVPVGKYALSWVQRYLAEIRPRYAKDKSHSFVFVSHKTGRPLTVWGVRWAVQQTLRRNGFHAIRPSSLRSTSATAMLENGMSVYHISTLLGHVELRTTQIYLNVRLKRLKEELAGKHPRLTFEKMNRQRKEQEHEV